MLATSIVALTARSVASSSGPPHADKADSPEANPAPDAMRASSCRLRRSSGLLRAALEDGSELIGHRQRRRCAIAPADERTRRGIVTEP